MEIRKLTPKELEESAIEMEKELKEIREDYGKYIDPDYFKTHLPDRDNTYEIDLELQARKLIQSKLHHTFELQKNEDKYGYDLSVFRYYQDGGEHTKKMIGFIEVEVSNSWKDKYPGYWSTYSFLARKVFQFDWNDNEFFANLKNDAEKTIYIIFNGELTDSCCCDITTISQFKKVNCDVTGKFRNDSFLRTDLQDPNVIRGLDECFDYINEFMLNNG